MKVRKVLGGVDTLISQKKFCVAKLFNGQYAVGHIDIGDTPNHGVVFSTLEQATDFWAINIPMKSNKIYG